MGFAAVSVGVFLLLVLLFLFYKYVFGDPAAKKESIHAILDAAKEKKRAVPANPGLSPFAIAGCVGGVRNAWGPKNGGSKIT